MNTHARAHGELKSKIFFIKLKKQMYNLCAEPMSYPEVNTHTHTHTNTFNFFKEIHKFYSL